MSIARSRRTRHSRAAAGLLAAAASAALLAAAPAASASAAPQLRFKTINVPGATATSVSSINDQGIYAGYYQTASGWYGFIAAGTHLTRFSYPGSTQTFVSCINDQGAVVGYYLSHGAYRGFLRSPAGQFTSLNDPLAGAAAGQGTLPLGINDDGVVTGAYFSAADHGFLYRSGRFTTLDVPHAYYGKPHWGSEAIALNNAGVTVGVYTPSSKNEIQGYVRTAGRFITLIAPGAGTRTGDYTFPEAIANTGAITGYSLNPGLVWHGWLLSQWRYTPLNDPLASTTPTTNLTSGTLPESINQEGAVAGTYYDAHHAAHGFIVHTGITRAATGPGPEPPAAPATVRLQPERAPIAPACTPQTTLATAGRPWALQCARTAG
jgi:hypothetical protein